MFRYRLNKLGTKKQSWPYLVGGVAVVVLLVFVINPEVRAFLLMADLIGLETLLLLFATQFRAYGPIIGGHLRTLWKTAGFGILFCRRATKGLMPFKDVGLLAEGVVVVCASWVNAIANKAINR